MPSDYTNSKGTRFVAGRQQYVNGEPFDPTREDHRQVLENWPGQKDRSDSTEWPWTPRPGVDEPFPDGTWADDNEPEPVVVTSPDSVVVTTEGASEVTVVTENTHQNVRSGRKSSVTPGSMDIRRP